MKDKKFIILSSIFFLLFFMSMVMVSFDRPISQILRARTSNPSSAKSFIVPFPQIATVGSKIKASVYIRGVNGETLPSRAIKLTTNSLSVTIIPSETQNTNDIGQAEFFITSDIPEKVQIQAVDVVSNTTIVNVPTVEFTQ